MLTDREDDEDPDTGTPSHLLIRQHRLTLFLKHFLKLLPRADDDDEDRSI
jgi:hypothetical protein